MCCFRKAKPGKCYWNSNKCKDSFKWTKKIYDLCTLHSKELFYLFNVAFVSVWLRLLNYTPSFLLSFFSHTMNKWLNNTPTKCILCILILAQRTFKTNEKELMCIKYKCNETKNGWHWRNQQKIERKTFLPKRNIKWIQLLDKQQFNAYSLPVVDKRWKL